MPSTLVKHTALKCGIVAARIRDQSASAVAHAIVIGFFLALGLFGAAGADNGEVFTATIRPLLKEYCLGCHSTEKQKGELDLEPFSSLDAAQRESTGRSVVTALRTIGATAVLVTHDQNEALSLADQVGVMRDGRLVQVGSPVELYRSPVDPEVAAFVGGATVLPAQVKAGVAQCALGRLRVAGGAAQGDVSILIRPEQIQLHEGETHGVSARVAEVSFFGHDASVRLDLLPSGPDVLARIVGAAVPETGALVQLLVDGPAMVFTPPDIAESQMLLR